MPDSVVPRVLSRADELNSKGTAFHAKGELDPARIHYLAALSLEPNHPFALQNLSGLLSAQEQFDMAASVGRRAVAANPSSAHAKANLAVALLGLREYEKARRKFEDVTEILTQDASAWHNLGLALYMLNEHHKALRAFEKSLKLNPNNLLCQSDRALSLLALGRLQEGLEAYEVRWNLLWRSPVWELGIEEWKGQNLEGKHVLAHHEQGFGDSIMLGRFLNDLRFRGAKVTVAVPQELVRLFAHNFSWAEDVISFENLPQKKAEDFDYHVPFLSMIRWLGYKYPEQISAEPYLSAPPSTVKLNRPGFRVGICWASGDHSRALTRRRRVVPLPLFLPLTELPNTCVIALQKGEAQKEISAIGAEGIIFDPMQKCEDFADTAAVIADLDLVISVDSAVAHLAGALGKPTIVLGPYSRCWRWWKEPNGMPWYDFMRIYPQKVDGSWKQAVSASIGVIQGRFWPLEASNRA